VADAWQCLERCLRDQRMQRFAPRQRNPWIVLAPEYSYRAPNVAEHRLDFGGILLIRLRELPIEACPSLLGQPRLDQLLDIARIDVVDHRPLDVGLYDGPVDMRRQAQKGIHMAADMIEELGSPGAHRDDIHQEVPIEVAAMQQVRPQRRRATQIMGDHDGPLDVPMRKHLGEYLALHIERRALLPAFVGSSVSGHIVPMDTPPPGEVRNHPMP
jgi:hypothetical protein